MLYLSVSFRVFVYKPGSVVRLSLLVVYIILSLSFFNFFSRSKSYFAILFVYMPIMKRKFKQRWSTTPSISKKLIITSDLNSLNTEKWGGGGGNVGNTGQSSVRKHRRDN